MKYRQVKQWPRLLAVLLIVWTFLWLSVADVWLGLADHQSTTKQEDAVSRSFTKTEQRQGRISKRRLTVAAYLEDVSIFQTTTDNNAEQLLPLREQTKDSLKRISYPRTQSCGDIPSRLPVFHNEKEDKIFGPNVNNIQSLYDLRFAYAKEACPVDADPFLPWIHDYFLSDQGVEFVAHNKRRCNTDAGVFGRDIANLEPQVSLFQPVPVVLLSEHEVRKIAPPSMWNNDTAAHALRIPRYRLATSFDEATHKETRFICRYHDERQNFMGETLSVYPYNYELANLRKSGSKPMLTRPETDKKNSTHNEQIWNSVLHFTCPVPNHLKKAALDANNIMLDLVPIRTRPRLSREGIIEGVAPSQFDGEWGNAHVLPLVESSGRWSNLPLCSSQESSGSGEPKATFLTGCTWAKSSFSTRGSSTEDASTSSRLFEWLTYHLDIAGFDHIYVYDNSNEPNNTLEHITSQFGDKVSRISWPHRVCNNNRPAHRNMGERSSQYAAETSCRVRYGPTTEWMVFFDPDEYLIPQATWTNLRQWLGSVSNGEASILSFYQSRALPNIAYMEGDASNPESLIKLSNKTFLQVYDCESEPLPKPDTKWRAMKQIYKPSYVLNHFVHYSTVTRRIIDHPNENMPGYIQRKPFERRVNELEEAFMLHAKTTPADETRGWKQRCHHDSVVNNNKKGCSVGIAFPLSGIQSGLTEDKNGFVYNCFQHESVQRLVPAVEKAMAIRRANADRP